MKKISWIVILLVIACLFTGCNFNLNILKRASEKKNSIKIGVSVYDQYDTFIDSLIKSLNACVKEKEQITGVSITVDIVNAGGSQITQNEQVENFANKSYDIICVNLVDRTDTSVIIDKAKSSNIPIIFFNRELVAEDLERWNQLYYVGATAVDSGILQGKLVVDMWNEDSERIDKNKDGKIQYVMLEGEAGHQDSSVRTEYSIKTIMDAGIPVEKLANGIANWNRAQASNQVMNWIQVYGNQMELIIANNDDMALGALDTLYSIQSFPEGYPIVVGIDGTEVALLELQKGNLAGTVLNDEYGQAKGILELSYSLAMKTELPSEIKLMQGKYIRIPYEQVTSKNIEQIMAQVKKKRDKR